MRANCHGPRGIPEGGRLGGGVSGVGRGVLRNRSHATRGRRLDRDFRGLPTITAVLVQNVSFAPICICREVVVVELMEPADGVFTYGFGLAKFGWFAALNTSPRSCIL